MWEIPGCLKNERTSLRLLPDYIRLIFLQYSFCHMLARSDSGLFHVVSLTIRLFAGRIAHFKRLVD